MAREITPTPLQKRLLEKLPEANSVSEAMIDAGYSRVSAKNPKLTLQGKGFRKLLDECLPDELLMKVHLEGLEASKVVSARAKTKHGDPIDADEDTDDFIEVPDHPTRYKFLELGHKIKGNLSGEAASITNVIVPIIIQRGEDTSQNDNATPEAV